MNIRGTRAPRKGTLKQFDRLLETFDITLSDMVELIYLHETMPDGSLSTSDVAKKYNLNKYYNEKLNITIGDHLLLGCNDQDGYFGKWGICQPCPIGQYGPTNTNICIKCGKGQYSSNEGQSSCSHVNEKEYVDTIGANRTKKCGLNSFSRGSGLETTGVQNPNGEYCRCKRGTFRNSFSSSTEQCDFDPVGSLSSYCITECRSKNTADQECINRCYCHGTFTGGHIPNTCNNVTKKWIMPETTFQGIYAAPGYWQDKKMYDLNLTVNRSIYYTAEDEVINDMVWNTLRFRKCSSKFACPSLSNDTSICDNGFTGACKKNIWIIYIYLFAYFFHY